MTKIQKKVLDPVISVNKLKHCWYKNTTAEGGAMTKAISLASADQMILFSHHQKDGRMWTSMDPEKLLNLLNKNRGFYEVINKYPYKVYFDIDGDSMCNISNIKIQILEFFPQAEMAISGSVIEDKVSYHIVLQNYIIHNIEEREHLKYTVKYLNNKYNYFDWKVYTPNRNMKMINQSKQDDDRIQAIIEIDNMKGHCITAFINDYSLKFPELPEIVQDEIFVEKSKLPFDLGTLPKLNLILPKHVCFTTLEAVEILELLPLDKSYNHAYTHLIARFCYFNKLTFEIFLAWLQKKHTDLSKVLQRWTINWSKLDKFPLVNIGKIKNILLYFYPHIGKDKSYMQFVETFEFDKTLITKIPTISQTEFKIDKKYLIFNIGMGGGKTYQTAKYLQTVSSFCWICPNRALAHNTYERLTTDFKIDVHHYSNDTTKAKKNRKLIDHTNMIIVANSLHYLFEKDYHTIVIDEVETFIDKWFGVFMKNKKTNWNIFLNLIKRAKKVILLDAFITTKTLDLINAIEQDAPTTTVIFERLNESTTRTINYMASPQLMIHNIIQDLKAGLKLFIFYPFKNASDFTKGAISMEGLYNLFKQESKTDGIYYNADIDESIKIGIKDVNDVWKDKQFIITNSMITCGVNYDRTDFDKEYIFVASFCQPRQIIQVSYRPRFLSSGIINMCYMGAMRQQGSWEHDSIQMACPIYTKMCNGILIELNAPLKKTIQLFCTKAHYYHKIDESKLSNILDKQIIEMLTKYNNSCSFTEVIDIDEDASKYLQHKLFDGSATMYDKFTLQKYFFKQEFSYDAREIIYTDFIDHNALEYAWNTKYSFFFDQVRKIYYDKQSVFLQIQKLNNLPTIFPIDIKKTKLNNEIIETIFKYFKFKYLNKMSNHAILIKELYNTYFMKTIILTKVKGTHTIYEINTPHWNYWADFLVKYNNKPESLTTELYDNLFLNIDSEELIEIDI